MPRNLAGTRTKVTRVAVSGRGTSGINTGGSQPSNPPLPSAPTISNIVISNVTTTSFTVDWDLDQPSQGWVKYGTSNGGPWGSETTHETSFSYSHHTQTVSGLTAGTTYYFKVVAVNAASQETDSTQQTQATNSSGSSGGTGGSGSGVTYTDYNVPGGVTTLSGLRSWIDANVTLGSDYLHMARVNLGAGRTYTGTTPFEIGGLHDILIEGGGTESSYGHTGGATLQNTSTSWTSTDSSVVRHYYNTVANNIVFHALSVIGSSTNYATRNAASSTSGVPYYEDQMGFCLYGTDNIEISHVIMDKCHGDGVFMYSDGASRSYHNCSNVWIHNSSITNNGRQGIAPCAVNGCKIQYNYFKDIAYGVVDIEPDASYQNINNFDFSYNVIDGGISWDSHYDDGIVNVTGTGSLTGYFKVIGNTFNGYIVDVTQNGSAYFKLHNGAIVKSAVATITGNVRTTGGSGVTSYSLYASSWTGGMTITGNTGWNPVTAFYIAYPNANSSPLTISGNS